MKIPAFQRSICAWFVVAFFLFASSCTYAQSNKFSVGIQAGPGLNHLRGNSILKEYHHSSPGFTAGVSVSYKLNTHLSVSSGLSYIESGSGIGPSDVYDNNGQVMGESKSKMLYRYVMLPVTIDHATGKKIRFVAGGGGFVGYLTDARQKGVIKKSSGDIRINEPNTDLKKINVGVVAKAGLEMPVRKNRTFYVTLADHLGLINISKTPVIDDGSIKTNSLNLLIGMKWPF